MKNIKDIIGIILIVLTITSCNNSVSKNINGPLINWAQKNSHEIETLELKEQQNDLNSLKQIVGKAKVVCLGESRHDIHEQFKLKHRFIKYLVEELDFTTFILEGSLPYLKQINEYITNGIGNIDEIMANMPGWFLWDTQEMTEIINWMKAYNLNSDNKKKIQFHGIDIVAPNYALNQIFAYLKKVDTTILAEYKNKTFAQDIINDNNWTTSLQGYSELTSDEKEILSVNYNELYEQIKQNETKYISNSSNEEYNWILRLAYCVNEANKMFSAEKRIEMGLIRDNAMAQNTLWIKQNLSNDEKMIIWAHNVHIAKAEFTMTGEEESIKGMGYILSQEFKDKMISIGASFNQGEFQDWDRSFPPAEASTIDGTLAKLKMKYFMLDLKGKTDDKDVKNWLNTDKIMRGQEFEMTCIPVKSFDAIYFVDRITRTIPNQKSSERFRI